MVQSSGIIANGCFFKKLDQSGIDVTLLAVQEEAKTTTISTPQLALIALARFSITTGVRMVYPFAPALARGLGVPLTAVYQLITLRNLAGFLSPLFGPLSERYGRRPVMIGSMLLVAASFLLVLIWPVYWPLGVSLGLIALLKVIFDPAMQAYIGDNVPYARRGRAIAITEFSWAGAMLVGTPLLSVAITRQGWQAPFIWLGGFSAVMGLLLWRRLPRSRNPGTNRGHTLRDTMLVVRQQPVIWAAATYMMLIMGANELLFIVYGDWMEASFGLSLIALGVSTTVIGGAEIIGEMTAGWSVDRFGKRPVILTTALLNGLFCYLLPFTAGQLNLALISYFALFLFFEITVVGGIPLMTELVPTARSVVMAMMLAAGALGRALGSLLGPWLFARFTFTGNGVAAALSMAAAVFILFLWVREGNEEPIARDS